MSDILGNEKLLQNLKEAAVSGHVSHGYIFNGAEGTGKKLIADYFAKMLLCTGENKPCNKCLSCLQWESKNQPDILYVSHDKPNVISVDDIREGINHSMSIKPYNGPYKIYIVDEAEKMNVQAQNALLKTLEEPPEYGMILLLTTNADAFLDTIRSRCVRLEVRPLKDELIERVLRDKGYTEEQIEGAVPMAEGSLGRAMALSESEEFRELYQNMQAFLRNLGHSEMKDLLAFSGEMVKQKAQAEEQFSFFRMWFRDVFVYKTSHDKSLLRLKKEEAAIKEQAERMSFASLEKIFRAIDTAGDRLKANVNYDLTQELMLLTVREQI